MNILDIMDLLNNMNEGDINELLDNMADKIADKVVIRMRAEWKKT